MEDSQLKVLSVINPKGGMAKTFTCQSLAVELSLMSKGKLKILLVDGDGSRNTTTSAIEKIDTIDKTLKNIFEDKNSDISEAIYDCTEQFPGIFVLAGDEDLESPSDVIGNRKNRETILKRSLEKLKGFDLAIIDTPATRNLITQNAMAACDYYLVPIDHDKNGVNGFLATKDMLKNLLDEEVIKKEPICIGGFFTRVSEGHNVTKIADNALKELIKEGVIHKDEVLKIRVPFTPHTKEATWADTTLQFQRKHKVTKCYTKLANIVVKKMDISLKGAHI